MFFPLTRYHYYNRYKCHLQVDEGNAGGQFKQWLTASPVLAHQDFAQPFIFNTDGSATGIGAVLSQRHPYGTEKVISYASRTLSKPNAIIAQLLTSCWPLSYL